MGVSVTVRPWQHAESRAGQMTAISRGMGTGAGLDGVGEKGKVTKGTEIIDILPSV